MKAQNTWKTNRDAKNSQLAKVFATPEPEAAEVAKRIHWVFGYETKGLRRRPLVAPRIETPILVPVQ